MRRGGREEGRGGGAREGRREGGREERSPLPPHFISSHLSPKARKYLFYF
jgi:hypothetical protein